MLDIYESYTISELRTLLQSMGGAPGNKKKGELIEEIIKIKQGEITPVRSNRGRPSTKAKRVISDSSIAVLNDINADDEVSVEGILSANPLSLVGLNFLPKVPTCLVSPQFVQDYNLIAGDKITGTMLLNKSLNVYELVCILKINDAEPKKGERQNYFNQEILPITQKITVSTTDSVTLKLIDLFCPIAKGQRSLIYGASNTGKTSILKELINAILVSEKSLFVALIDQRPEDISSVKHSSAGGIVNYTTFDMGTDCHITLAETTVNRAVSLATEGKNVVVILDGVNKLVKAYFAKLGDMQKALLSVKKLLSVALNKKGASITILSFCNIEDTDEDNMILDELKSISNMIICLDQMLSKNRIYPAINLNHCECKNIYEILNGDIVCYDLIYKILAINPLKNAEIIRLLQKHIFSDRLKDRLQELLLLTENS